MRVVTNPGLVFEADENLADVLQRTLREHNNDRAVLAWLLALLVERGVLNFDDTRRLGAPHMEEVK